MALAAVSTVVLKLGTISLLSKTLAVLTEWENYSSFNMKHLHEVQESFWPWRSDDTRWPVPWYGPIEHFHDWSQTLLVWPFCYYRRPSGSLLVYHRPWWPVMYVDETPWGGEGREVLSLTFGGGGSSGGATASTMLLLLVSNLHLCLATMNLHDAGSSTPYLCCRFSAPE